MTLTSQNPIPFTTEPWFINSQHQELGDTRDLRYDPAATEMCPASNCGSCDVHAKMEPSNLGEGSVRKVLTTHTGGPDFGSSRHTKTWI